MANEQKSNAFIAFSAVIAALVMAAALSLAIGKWSFGNSSYPIYIRFPNAVGVDPNTSVKFAGANVGRVASVQLIPRREQVPDPLTNQFNAIRLKLQIDQGVEIGKDSIVTIKQDGVGIAPKYILISAGPDHDSPVLVGGEEIQGRVPYDLADLLQPAGEALAEAREMLAGLRPTLTRLDHLSSQLDTEIPPLLGQIPPLMDHANKFILDGDSFVTGFNTASNQRNLQEMIASLRVSSENLKVVSTNAKAFTATIAEKPWRVFWGGASVKPPPEDQVLSSSRVIHLQPNVEVIGPGSSAGVEPAPAKKP